MAPSPSPIHVLLVEDDDEDVELTKNGLVTSKLHIDLQVVEDGALAISYLRKEAPYENARLPDLIFLDINLPKKNGHEVLQEIRQHDVWKRIPIVILTTSDQEEDILKSYELGANCHVTKPLGLSEYSQIVNAIEMFWFSVVKLPPHA